MQSWRILALAMSLAGTVAAQTGAPASSEAQKPAPASSTSSVNASEPVITIENLCPDPKPGAPCQTLVTRAEFEHLLGTLRTNIPPGARMQIAQKYAELLTFAEKGEQAGVEKTTEFQDQLRMMRLQALAGGYTRYLQEKYGRASDAEVEKYYKENLPAYEEVTLRRIYIPKPIQGADKKPLLDEAATKALAQKIQARAAAGEDFDKLQQEAFTATTPDAPKAAAPTTLGPRRHGQLPQTEEAALFELAPGKVSSLMEEPAGFFIYKVESKQTLPLESVKAQIARQLEEQKLRDAIQQAMSSAKTTFNDDYFKVPAKPEAAPPPAKGTEQHPSSGKPKAPAAHSK